MFINLEEARNKIKLIREARSEDEQQLASNREALSRHAAEKEALVRTGTPESAGSRDRTAALIEERESLLASINGRQNAIDEITGETVADTPENVILGLKGALPIALLPVRLETRFSSDNSQLFIRIYPDQIHIDNHPEELTPQECEIGKAYWRIRSRGNTEEAQATWIKLAQQFSPTRAAWIIQILEPANFAIGVDQLDFPDVAERGDNSGHVPQAKLLPERWIALGFAKDESDTLVPLFSRWADNTIPDTLNASVSFDEIPAILLDEDQMVNNVPEGTLPIDKGMLWTVDYEEAKRVGMAITVENSDLASTNRELADGIDFLVVLGVDWTLTAEESAKQLCKLFVAHHYSDGMAFIPQGTPTNNTGLARSGFTSDPVAIALASDPVPEEKKLPEGDHAAQRMAAGLGFADSKILERLPNAGLQEQVLTSAMVDALWESTLGFFLDELLDPLATDRIIDFARDHAARFLQPFGPFAAMRIGQQPYGLLPVSSLKEYKPRGADGVEKTALRVLSLLADYWREGLKEVAFIGKSSNPDDDLLAILQLNSLSASKRFRRVADASVISNADGYGQFVEIQADLRDATVFGPFAEALEAKLQATKLDQKALSATSYRLYGPWVQGDRPQPGDGLNPNYIDEIIGFIKGGLEGRKQLHERTKKRTLLEALLAFSALRELDRAGAKVIDSHLLEKNLISELPPKSSLQIHSLTGIFKVEDAEAGDVFVETPEQQASLLIKDLAGNTNELVLSEFLSEQISDTTPANVLAPLRNLSTFIASLEEAATYPAEQIDRTFRSVLDCYGYRLDAWITSLASKRLEEIREESKSKGLHIGGYGWVENLGPDPKDLPDSLGFVHAPSIAHASTAAIMRSGHLSHRGPENSEEVIEAGLAESALNIDMSSERVRQALILLDGIAQGKSLAELLGYRFERGLRDIDATRLRLMQYILPFRKIAPLRDTVPEMSEPAAESIAVRDVVDGIKLLEAWREDGEELLDQLPSLAPAGEEAELKKLMVKVFERTDDLLDAVSDVLVAETVYQTVRGNYERAGAALAALDRQSIPPDPQVARTPRSGIQYQQRVLLLLQEDKESSDFPTDLRATLEPRLNIWIAKILGDPARFILAAEVEDNTGALEDLTATLEEFSQEMNFSPLALVMMSVGADPDQPSQLEGVLGGFFADRAEVPAAVETVTLLAEPAAGLQDNQEGFGVLLELLHLLQRLVSRPRSAAARDLVPSGLDVKDNVDTADLEDRLSQGIEVIETAVNAFEQVNQADDFIRVLKKSVHVAGAEAYPETSGTDAAALTVLKAQAERVITSMEQMLEQLAQKDADEEIVDPIVLPPNLAIGEDTEAACETAHLIDKFHIILGDAFPVLPLFIIDSADAQNGDPEAILAAELAASLADRQALTGGDEFAALTFLQQMAMVRPQIESLVAVLTAGEMLGMRLDPGDFQIMQLPHLPGQVWAGLPFAESPPQPPNEPALALLTVGQFNLEEPVSGIIFDGWNEFIPAAEEMTGITFHYDAPAARAPQAVLLAVHPSLELSLDDTRWDLKSLLATVLETYELASLRAIGPKEMPTLGGVLPTIFLPQDRSSQIPSVEFADFGGEAPRVLGKTNF